jgi:hypothetical protein
MDEGISPIFSFHSNIGSRDNTPHQVSSPPLFFPSLPSFNGLHLPRPHSTTVASSSRQPPSDQVQERGSFARRFPGDGLDFRRPASTNALMARSRQEPHELIDLTSDNDESPSLGTEAAAQGPERRSRTTRLPRYQHDIIEIDDRPSHNERETSQRSTNRPAPVHADDVVFVEQRPRQAQRSQRYVMISSRRARSKEGLQLVSSSHVGDKMIMYSCSSSDV